MDRSLRWRSIILLVILLFCVATLIPSVVPNSQLPSWFKTLFSSRIALGTDIAGGSRFEYSIDLDKAVDDKASEIKRDLEATLAEDGIKGTVKAPSGADIPVGAVTVIVDDATKVDAVKKRIDSEYGGGREPIAVTRPCAATDPAGAICIRVSSDYAEGIKRAALTNAVSTIRERIDEKGIAEPSVIEKGDNVIVELPQLDDDSLQRIRDIIARTAKLEFKVVDNNAPWMRDLFAHVTGDETRGIPADPTAVAAGIEGVVDGWNPDSGGHQTDFYLFASDREEALELAEAAEYDECAIQVKEAKAANVTGKIRCNVQGRHIIDRYLRDLAAKDPKFKLPDDRQLSYEYIENPGDAEENQKPFWRTYYLDRAVRLSGSAVLEASQNVDPQTNHPVVLVDFNRYGGRVFGDLTAANIGKKIATILDDKVKSAPIINEPIRGGRCSITMGGSNTIVQEKEAKDLVAVLKTGSLPAPLREESMKKIGATLGRDAVDKAKLSFTLGVFLVIVIMVGIYKWSGFIAVGAVVFHIILTLAVMALFGATLTLPGIAAIVLSVGMEVDGNILIYERIRDELLTGKSVRGAVDLGFSRAFSAILDGQLTIAAAGWVLLNYGSGPIKGFAVMLLVGVFTTLTTNVWVTRIFFDWYIAKQTKKQGQMATISI
jgi:preprotein translocase subunit SecD